jgi:hypothetical protein
MEDDLPTLPHHVLDLFCHVYLEHRVTVDRKALHRIKMENPKVLFYSSIYAVRVEDDYTDRVFLVNNAYQTSNKDAILVEKWTTCAPDGIAYVLGDRVAFFAGNKIFTKDSSIIPVKLPNMKRIKEGYNLFECALAHWKIDREFWIYEIVPGGFEKLEILVERGVWEDICWEGERVGVLQFLSHYEQGEELKTEDCIAYLERWVLSSFRKKHGGSENLKWSSKLDRVNKILLKLGMEKVRRGVWKKPGEKPIQDENDEVDLNHLFG